MVFSDQTYSALVVSAAQKFNEAFAAMLPGSEYYPVCFVGNIAAARRELIARLNTFILHEPDDVFPNVELSLEGTIEQMLDSKPAIDVEDYYIGLLQKQRKNVLYSEYVDGINRTDFKVLYKKKRMPAELCSTGEQKSLLVGIIMAQTKCQTLDKGFAPVLLLDEVTTHLDDVKRDALLHKIKDLHLQAWITSTEPQNFAVLRESAQFIETDTLEETERGEGGFGSTGTK